MVSFRRTQFPISSSSAQPRKGAAIWFVKWVTSAHHHAKANDKVRPTSRHSLLVLQIDSDRPEGTAFAEQQLLPATKFANRYSAPV
jgi:hypothetical protein